MTSIAQGTTTLRSFLYDGAGNITKDTRGTTATDYAYGNNGRLRTVTVGGSLKGTYTYDGMERFAIRAVTNSTPSGTTHFIHLIGGGGLFDELMPTVGPMMGGLGNRVIAETNGAGVSLREYIWLGDQVLAVVANANTTSAVMYWITNDHLGRPVQMNDAARAVVWRAKYRPFGEVSEVTGPASLDARFPGQWFQLESGLSYNWHRHYDASLGRYTQPDPLGLVDGPSVYGYVRQNPMMGVDPEGLQDVSLGHGGFIGRVDSFTSGGRASFEIHVYSPKGMEIGIYTPNGWIQKHGLSVPPNTPVGLENTLRGICVARMRAMGIIPPKGTANIRRVPTGELFGRGSVGGGGIGGAVGKQN